MKKVKSKIPMQYLSKHTQALLVLAIVLASTPIFGQTRSGTLDASFGAGGIVTTDFGILDQGFSVAYAASLAVQLDGRMVAAGRAYINGGFHSGLARYNSDGTLDASFGTGGKVTADFQGPYGSDQFTSVIVQPDGKIVAAVGGLGDFTLVRYNN